MPGFALHYIQISKRCFSRVRGAPQGIITTEDCWPAGLLASRGGALSVVMSHCYMQTMLGHNAGSSGYKGFLFTAAFAQTHLYSQAADVGVKDGNRDRDWQGASRLSAELARRAAGRARLECLTERRALIHPCLSCRIFFHLRRAKRSINRPSWGLWTSFAALSAESQSRRAGRARASASPVPEPLAEISSRRRRSCACPCACGACTCRSISS
jgi:hypothetical protein